MKYVDLPLDDVISWKPYISRSYRTFCHNELVRVEAIRENIEFDFIGFNKMKLLEAGVPAKNIVGPECCTYDSSVYPSHYRAMRERKRDNRFMVAALMTKY